MNFWKFQHDSTSNSLLIWDFVEVDSFFDLRWFAQKVELWFGRGGLGSAAQPLIGRLCCLLDGAITQCHTIWSCRSIAGCPTISNCSLTWMDPCCMLYAIHIILQVARLTVWSSSSFATGVVKPTINHIPFCNTRWVLPHCHFHWKVSMFCMGSLESMADLRRGELAAQRIWGQTIRGSRVERAQKKDISKKFRENTSKIMKWNYHYILESDYPLFGCPPCFSF